eukprot:1855708-Pleurochrysis_carterae.AAC.1
MRGESSVGRSEALSSIDVRARAHIRVPASAPARMFAFSRVSVRHLVADVPQRALDVEEGDAPHGLEHQQRRLTARRQKCGPLR